MSVIQCWLLVHTLEVQGCPAVKVVLLLLKSGVRGFAIFTQYGFGNMVACIQVHII